MKNKYTFAEIVSVRNLVQNRITESQRIVDNNTGVIEDRTKEIFRKAIIEDKILLTKLQEDVDGYKY